MLFIFVIAAVFFVLVSRSRIAASGSEPRLRGWSAFALWALAGALLCLFWLTGLSIGVLIFPFALAALFASLNWAARWPESLGGLTGVGVTLLFVAYRHWNDCAWQGTCGGERLDPAPWMFSGLAFLAAGFLFYALLRPRRFRDARIRGAGREQ